MEGVVGLVLQAMHTHLREGKNHGLSAGRRKRVKTLVLKNVLTFIIAGTRLRVREAPTALLVEGATRAPIKERLCCR